MSVPRSPNGWPLLTKASQTVIFTAGGRQFRAANPVVKLVAQAFITLYATLVEPIDEGQLDDWSWAQRAQRGSTTVASCHWSATAWDLNALRHPRGRSANLTAGQLRTLRQLLALFAPVFKWGGDFRTVVDPMHFELAIAPNALIAWASEHIDLLDAAKEGRLPRPAPTDRTVPEDELDMDGQTLQRLVRDVIFEEKTLDKLAEAVWTRRRVETPHPVKGTVAPMNMETLLGRAASVIPDGKKAGVLHTLQELVDKLGEDVATTVLTHPIQDDRGTWSLAERVAGVDRTLNAPMRSAVEGCETLIAPREIWRQSDARLRVALQALGATQAVVRQLVALVGQVHGVDTATVIASVNTAIVDAVVKVEAGVEETAATAPAELSAPTAGSPS